jgi:hypothetical protein
VTLLAKARNDYQLKQADRSLKAILKGLDAKLETVGMNSRGWIQISIIGQDEQVALKYLSDKIGFCSLELEKVTVFSTFKGFIRDSSQDKNELVVDLGISNPKYVDAIIPLNRLQAQIGDGRKIALSKLSELFGLRENVPLNIRVTQANPQEQHIEAELSDEQQKRFAEWTLSMLDRLLVIGASYSEVRSTIRRSNIIRDVINIEPLGMFEHAIVCKLGTDAAGLIPKIGNSLQKAVFTVYNPRNIVRLLGSDAAASG